MENTISQIAQIWDQTLLRVKKAINDQKVYDSFFSESYVDSIKDNIMYIVVNSVLGTVVLDTKYRETISQCMLDATGTNFDFKFITAGEVSKIESEKPVKSTFFQYANLNLKLTFDNFVVGSSNREAYQASLLISNSPGQFYNPLLIYGDSGLGKTHLLMAIGNSIREHNPTSKVLYVTSHDFIDQYTKIATGFKETESLVTYFRKDVDVFLIDDIQFLAGKKKTMECFFDVFQSLASQGKQIVITSDKHPNKVDDLDERLKTRFSQGLAMEINRPDLETSKQILKAKIQASGLSIEDFDEEVINFLSGRFSSNIRELEGALNRLLFYTVNMRPTKHITMDVVTEAIQGLINIQEEQAKMSENKIIQVVSDYYSLTPAQLTGKLRNYEIANARHIAMYLIRSLLDIPFTRIGIIFGGKDHATVMSGVEKVEKLLESDDTMKKAISDIKSKLQK